MGGWDTHRILPDPAYLKKLPGNQPAPSLGAAPGGGSSLKKTPESSMEVAFYWDCCSSPPQTTC